MSALLLLAALGQVASAAAEPAYEIRTFEQAWQDFARLCVAPLPSPLGFTGAMNASGVRWRLVARTPAEILGTGNRWRSPLGQITYHYRREMTHVIGGPACHLEFRTDAGYRHAEAAAAMERLLALPPGRATAYQSGPQMQWDTRRADGMRIRVFLSSNVEVPGGAGARLSISRREMTPVPREMTDR